MRRFITKTTAGLLTIVALSGALALGCSGDEEEQDAPIVPAVEQQAQAEPQAEPVEFTVADAVRLAAETSEHADAARRYSRGVLGCDADSEREAMSVLASLASARESRDALVAGIAVYLEGATFSDVDGANEMISAANDSVYLAENIAGELGSCGHLTDDQLIELQAEMRIAYEEFWKHAGHAAALHEREVCNHPDTFRRAGQASNEFLALRKEFDVGKGTRERKWIAENLYSVEMTRQDYNRRYAAYSLSLKRFEHCD